jgi:hypothetical protein
VLMASEFYKSKMMISTPNQKSDAQWHPHAFIMWREQGRANFHFHGLPESTKVFDSEEKATEFGFKLTRSWINKATVASPRAARVGKQPLIGRKDSG